MVVEMVPVKGGIGGIVHPPIGRKNTTYIPLVYCLLGGYMLPNYHLLREPETTIEKTILSLVLDFQGKAGKNSCEKWKILHI